MGCLKCGAVERQTIMMDTGPHYAKEICADCGKFFKWIRNPDRELVLHKFFKPVGESGGHDFDYECCFGKKHYGELLSEIVEEDPKYLEWIARSDFPDEVIELVESVV